jgi:hypothetical protein
VHGEPEVYEVIGDILDLVIRCGFKHCNNHEFSSPLPPARSSRFLPTQSGRRDARPVQFPSSESRA